MLTVCETSTLVQPLEAHTPGHMFRRKAVLVGGDTLALLTFAAIGRGSHGESLDLGSVLSVAWPFLAGERSRRLSGAFK